MAKYIIFNTSPRPKGNCPAVAQYLQEKIEAAGNEVQYVDFRKANINYCMGCDACMAHTEPWCMQKDDMGELIPQIDKADGIVFLTPVYFYDVSAQAKTVIDRMYAFFNPSQPNMTVATGTGKKVATVMTSGSMTADALGAAIAEVNGAFGTAGFTENRVLVFNGLHAPGQIAGEGDKMAQIDELADWLLA